MTLDEATCWARLAATRHGVLATRHDSRGVDAVPVVFAVAAGRIVLPVDTVKSKRGGRLRRLDNLRGDPRCVLLVDHYNEDWSSLWWVRVHGRGDEAEPSPADLDVLAERYPHYRRPGVVTSVVVLTPTAVSGWEQDR